MNISGVPSVVIPECAKASLIRSTIDPSKPNAKQKREEADYWLALCKSKIEKLKGLEVWAFERGITINRSNMDAVISQADAEVSQSFIAALGRISQATSEDPHYIAVMLRGVGLPVDFSEDLSVISSQNADQFFQKLPEAEQTVTNVAVAQNVESPSLAIPIAAVLVGLVLMKLKS